MRKQGRERGAVMVLFALLVPLFVGMVGCAYDFGMLYWQKSRLQSAADAAALAGVHAEAPDYAARLVKIPDKMGDPFELTLGEKNYKLSTKKDKDSKKKADDKADKMIDANTNTKANPQGATLSASGLFRDNDKDAAAYQVTLTESFTTTFLRLFGKKNFDLKVSALAFAVPLNKGEIEGQAELIFKIAPNYYWETLADPNSRSFSITAANEGQKWEPRFIVEDPYGNKTTTGRTHSAGYHTTDVNNDNGLLIRVPYDEDVAGYMDRVTPSDSSGNVDGDFANRILNAIDTGNFETIYQERNIDSKFCAEDIPLRLAGCTEARQKESLGRLSKLAWDFDEEFFRRLKDLTKSEDDKTNEIDALFVDQPNIRANITDRSGRRAQAWDVRGIILNLKTGSWGNHLNIADTLLVRVESEPVNVYGGSNPEQAVTVAMPMTINVEGPMDEDKHHMIIAYEGPSSARTWQDAPFVQDNLPEYIQPLSLYKGSFANSPYLRLTSVKTSAPVTLNLNGDFNGVLYVPFSKVTITGTGKINGFVLAGEVVFAEGARGERSVLTQKLTIPVLEHLRRKDATGAYVTGTKKWDYRIRTETTNFKVVYDTFKTYLDPEKFKNQ